MERMWRSSKNLRFQSYLYGIEMDVRGRPAVYRGRFNRTFMELKLNKNTLDYDVSSVSIVPLWNWNGRPNTSSLLSHRFNRTFMELKLWSAYPCCGRAKFQSYLYGIEIVYCYNSLFHCCVSIVPLWNWNYGNAAHVGVNTNVSIVPLWNWNGW